VLLLLPVDCCLFSPVSNLLSSAATTVPQDTVSILLRVTASLSSLSCHHHHCLHLVTTIIVSVAAVIISSIFVVAISIFLLPPSLSHHHHWSRAPPPPALHHFESLSPYQGNKRETRLAANPPCALPINGSYAVVLQTFRNPCCNPSAPLQQMMTPCQWFAVIIHAFHPNGKCTSSTTLPQQ